MGKVHVTIDGIQVYVPDTYTVLEAAKEINIHIPTLCFLKDVSEIGCCRMCLVEVKGTRALQAACGLSGQGWHGGADAHAGDHEGQTKDTRTDSFQSSCEMSELHTDELLRAADPDGQDGRTF